MEAAERQSTSQTVTCGTERMNTIASMVREAIGDRTMTQFCSDAGLSVGYVSRLLNGRLKSVPSVKTLAKISCVACSGKAAAFFKKLLDASGHSLEEEEIQKEIQNAEHTTGLWEQKKEKDIQKSYGIMGKNAAAMGLLFSTLMELGVPISPKACHGSQESIEFVIPKFPYDRVIAVGGFCGNSCPAQEAERDILQQLLKHVSKKNQGVPMYIVLTDQRDVYGYIIETTKALPVSIYVLLAGEDYQGFTDQSFHREDGREVQAPFDFVEVIRNKS